MNKIDYEKKIEIKNKLSLIKTGLIDRMPFVMSFLENLRLVISNDIETAAVNEHTIYINPDYFTSLSNLEAEFTIIHEALHIALADVNRLKMISKNDNVFSPTAWNIASDIVNNEMIVKDTNLTSSNGLFYEHIYGLGYPRDRSGTKEDMYRWLLENTDIQCKFECYVRDMINSDDNNSSTPNGETIYEGSNYKEFSKAAKDANTYEREIKNAVARSYNYAKTIGNVPAGLDRAINKLLGGKLDWRKLISEKISSDLSKYIVTTYKRRSRRCKVLPGVHKYATPNIRLLLDTSGSITSKELIQFASEIYNASRITQSTIYVYPFDAQPYERFIIKRPDDILRNKIKGGGGTCIKETMKLVEKEMDKNDILIIMSDDGIFDANDDYVIEMLKNNNVLYITTVDGKQWDFLKDRKILLENL